MARLHKKRRILAAQAKEAEETAAKVPVVEKAPTPVVPVAPVENNSVVKKVVEKVTKKKV